MSDPIEFSDLMAEAGSGPERLQLARTLRSTFIDADADENAVVDHHGGRVTVTSSGQPMTVAQVQAELEILILGE